MRSTATTSGKPRRAQGALDFHVFALDWSETALVWYVDGVERRRVPNGCWHNPFEMVFDSEAMPGFLYANDTAGLAALAVQLPTHFDIDYVRAWQRAPELH
jgi:beta-glucanase (GH16 family)